MPKTLRSSFLILACSLLLSACSGLRVVDNDVASFVQWPNATPPAPGSSYRFERLPSQQSTLPQSGISGRELPQDQLEAMARAALSKVGWTNNPLAAAFNVQVSATMRYAPRNTFNNRPGYGGFGSRGVSIGGGSAGGFIGFSFPLGMTESPLYLREVSIGSRTARLPDACGRRTPYQHRDFTLTPQEPTRILAIRHGETSWNVDTRIQGHLNIPLNDTGHWQADRLGQALAGEDIAAIYASDLSRAHETAQYVGRATGVSVVPELGLRERGFGAFEGRTFAEIELALPDQAERWRKRDPAFAPTGGESLLQVRERVLAAVNRLAQRHPGELIVMVAHGGVMDVLYRAATRLDLQATRTWLLGNTAVNRLLWTSEGLSLVGWSDTQHLSDAVLDESSA
jgi:probable phosphoglycerate mutase